MKNVYYTAPKTKGFVFLPGCPMPMFSKKKDGKRQLCNLDDSKVAEMVKELESKGCTEITVQ